MAESSEISIPSEIYDKLQESLSASEASSVDELAGRILRDWLSKKDATARSPGRRRISKTDEKTMEDRLKALGYL